MNKPGPVHAGKSCCRETDAEAVGFFVCLFCFVLLKKRLGEGKNHQALVRAAAVDLLLTKLYREPQMGLMLRYGLSRTLHTLHYLSLSHSKGEGYECMRACACKGED